MQDKQMKEDPQESASEEIVKHTIPTSYTWWLCSCVFLLAVFLTLYVFYRLTGIAFLNPFVNLTLVLATVGMIATVVVAIKNWRKY